MDDPTYLHDLTALHEFRDVLPPADAAVLAAARRRLTDHAAATGDDKVLVLAPTRRRSLARRLVVGVAGAAAAATVAGILANNGGGGTGPSAAAGSHGPARHASSSAVSHGAAPAVVAAAKVLNLAALAAQNEPTLRPGQYRHVVEGHGDSVGTLHNDIWVPADPSGRWLWRDDEFVGNTRKIVDTWFSGRAGTTTDELYPARYSMESARGHKEPFVPQYPDMIRCPALDSFYDHTDCAPLPLEAHALLRALYRLQVPNDLTFKNKDQVAFAQIASILQTGVAPADLRVALYAALQLIPGVVSEGSAVNADGRRGVAVGMATYSSQWAVHQDLIFDEGGDYIGQRVVALGKTKTVTSRSLDGSQPTSPPESDDPKAGTLMQYDSLRVEVVDHRPTVPTP
jgi:hypothetical protein